MSSKSGTQSKSIYQSNGFSLVELLLAITIFATAVAVTASIFGGTSTMIQNAKDKNELGGLVDKDLAYIMQSNERLTCKASSCTLSASDTTRDSYFPEVNSSGAVSSTQNANIIFFQNLCSSTNTSNGFVAQLKSLVGAPADSRISRTITASPQNTPSHLYTVTYSTSSGKFLRQIHLSPTTVAWCPGSIP